MTPEDVLVQLQTSASPLLSLWLTTHRKRVVAVLQRVHPTQNIGVLTGDDRGPRTSWVHPLSTVYAVERARGQRRGPWGVRSMTATDWSDGEAQRRRTKRNEVPVLAYLDRASAELDAARMRAADEAHEAQDDAEAAAAEAAVPALQGTQDHARKVEPTEADMQQAREDHKGLRNFNWRQAVEHGEAKIADLLRAGAAAEAQRAALFAEADRRLRVPHSSPTAGASQRAEGQRYAKILDNIAHELVAERTFLYLAREKLAGKKPAPKRSLSTTISGHLGSTTKPNPYTTGDRWVYAIELSRDAAPNTRGPVVYVGQTALHPRERFERHKAGGMHASDVVTHYGVRLLPERSGPWVGEIEAERAERALAAELRKRGVTVMGGH